MDELRGLRVQLLLVGCLACLFRLGLWAWSYYEVGQWASGVVSHSWSFWSF